MEGLICCLISIKGAWCTRPTLRIIVTWSSLHHLCNPILDIPVQALPELHHNGQAIGVPSFIHQFRKLINVVIHRFPSLVVACGFEFGEGCSCLILWTELGAEVLFEISPGEEGRKVIRCFLSEDAVSMESCTSGLHKGEGAVDLGLFISELMLTYGDIESACIKKGSAFEAI